MTTRESLLILLLLALIVLIKLGAFNHALMKAFHP
jgi:hypothetical protein